MAARNGMLKVTPTRHMSVRLPVDLFNKLDKAARREGMTRTGFVEQIVRQRIEGAVA